MVLWILLILVFSLSAYSLVVTLGLRSRLKRVERDLTSTKQQAERREREQAEQWQHQGRVLMRVSQGKPVSEALTLKALPFADITGDAAWNLLETHRAVTLLDVRDPHEYAAGHIPGALWIPLGELEQRWKEVPREADYVIIHCAAGSRSAAACEYLSREHGYLNLYNLDGGLSAWPGPVETGGGR